MTQTEERLAESAANLILLLLLNRKLQEEGTFQIFIGMVYDYFKRHILQYWSRDSIVAEFFLGLLDYYTQKCPLSLSCLDIKRLAIAFRFADNNDANRTHLPRRRAL